MAMRPETCLALPLRVVARLEDPGNGVLEYVAGSRRAAGHHRPGATWIRLALAVVDRADRPCGLAARVRPSGGHGQRAAPPLVPLVTALAPRGRAPRGVS